MSTWWDRFGEEFAKDGLTDDPSDAQANAGWAYIGQAPPTVEQFNSMFQWSDDKDNWLYGQIVNVIASAGLTPSETDLTQLLQAIKSTQKLLLTANIGVYIDAVNGDDVNGDGNQNTPWRTIQRAYDWCKTYVEMAGYCVVAYLRPGTYEPIVAQEQLGGMFIIVGDPLNPHAYIIRNPNGTAVSSHYGSKLAVFGLSIEATGAIGDFATWGCGIVCNNSGLVVYQDIALGPCTSFQMIGQLGGNVWPNAAVEASVGYSIYGGGQCHIGAAHGGSVTVVRTHVTVENNPMFSSAFCLATVVGDVQAWGQVYTGTAQGTRAIADANGIISIQGADPDTYFPGTLPAVQQRGGMII